MSLILAPPSTATNGRLGLLRRPSSTSTSFCISRPIADGSVRGGPTIDACAAVACAERVVDIRVHAVDQRGDELRIVALLARVESEVLQELDARRQLGEALPDWLHRVLRVRLALGPTEVRCAHDVSTAAGQPFDGRQRGSDAEVVGDHPVVDRHVEVGAHQHPLAVHLAESRRRDRRGCRLTFVSPSWGSCCRRTAPCRRGGWSNPTRCRTTPAPSPSCPCSSSGRRRRCCCADR